MKIIYENSEIKISIIENGQSNSACICFTGVGHAMGGIDVKKEEFNKTNNFGVIIFIIDKNRSWGNNLDFIKIVQTINPYLKGKEVYSLGNSMNGFLSVVFLTT